MPNTIVRDGNKNLEQQNIDYRCILYLRKIQSILLIAFYFTFLWIVRWGSLSLSLSLSLSHDFGCGQLLILARGDMLSFGWMKPCVHNYLRLGTKYGDFVEITQQRKAF